MKIKSFTILIYMLAGLAIALVTSIMTYIIIGKPIKMPMIKQITMVVLVMAPAIGVLSYFFGTYLSKKFIFIEGRLEKIKKQNFEQDNSKNMLVEIDEINKKTNYLASRMNTLIEDLKQKNRNLSNLLASMAHDVKTPLTILSGYIEEIEDRLVSSKELPDVLLHMKSEVAFIDELTVDMLRYIESIDSKKIKNRICVYEVLEKNILPIFVQKNEVELINAVESKLYIDFNCLDFKRVSINLISNALKHTNRGYIKVYNIDSVIYFENSGTKIDYSHKESIFEPFYTIDKSKNRKGNGFGLGLSIVRNLSSSNGYNCYLNSSSKEKTLFVLEPKE